MFIPNLAVQRSEVIVTIVHNDSFLSQEGSSYTENFRIESQLVIATLWPIPADYCIYLFQSVVDDVCVNLLLVLRYFTFAFSIRLP